MAISLETFCTVANSAFFTSRDIKIEGKGDNTTARLGNYIFSAGKTANKAVMDAFKAALEKEYGSLGTHAFDTVLTSRVGLNKSLRACDVKATLSKLQFLKETRFVGELNRQLDTSPKVQQLPEPIRNAIKRALDEAPFKNCDLASCKTPADVARMVKKRIDNEIVNQCEDCTFLPQELGERMHLETEAKPNEPTGLRNLKMVMESGSTSVEDRIKSGKLGTGMRINTSETNPILLEKLKTNGVEPGFIYRNDWSKDDTRGLMAKIPADADRNAILAAGRAHPAGVAAAAEFLLQKAAILVQTARSGGMTISAMPASENLKNLARALDNHFTSSTDIDAIANMENKAKTREIVMEAKLELFTDVRDAVLGVNSNDAEYHASPIFKHFADRHIMKLDYNENDRIFKKDAAHAGSFQRPERILTTRKPILAQYYRLDTAHSADSISASAVTEALANDLTRLAGVPSQELEIVRGQYSDGHPKLMLQAKFAEGYKDMEDGFIQDGRVVKPKGLNSEQQLERLGKYKAFFLVTADRDAIGRRGQNKGFADGKFFAIDPGHSLEGNGKYLKVSSDLSFKDTFGASTKPRFENFSVFDDDTFFSKMKGVINLRETAERGDFKKLFDDYRATFDPNARGITDTEKTIRQKVWVEISKKEAEFNESLKKILDVSTNNLALYDDLSDLPQAVREGAIENVANLEKLTSPTKWTSKHGTVALDHLEVVPESRVPWRAALKGNDIVYYCDTRMSSKTIDLLEAVVKSAGGKFETDALGVTRVTVPKDKAEHFFTAFNEDKVQQLTHDAEYRARKEGGNGLKQATTYRPEPYRAGKDHSPLMNVDNLPDVLDFEANGQVYKFPKVHYQDLVTKESQVHCPRNVAELRALLSAQVNLGMEVLGALMSGRPTLFEPTNKNIVALTYALHAAALKKGEFMYRGSFSIEDKNGEIARWLDKANDLYIRTSTHAKPYQTAYVDGHLNMPRGYDVPTGPGGLLNGMRTFHFFTIPDADGLANGGNGNGPKRRLFLKCETFGIFCSTAHAKIFDKPASISEGMKTRSYRFGDIIESICHGSSLFASFFTPKEAPGIRKENLTKVQKNAILWAQKKLRPNYPQIAEHLTAGNVLDGAGINTLVDNLNWIVEHMPEDEDERAWVTDVLDYMFTPMEEVIGKKQGGDIASRIGNEIMIDADDIF